MDVRFDDFTWILAETASEGAPAGDAKGESKDAAKEGASGETSKDDSAPAEGQQPGGWGSMAPLLLIGGLFIVFLFFQARSKKRQANEHDNMVRGLKPGEKVMLYSGLFGKVDRVDSENNEIRLVVDEEKNVRMTFAIQAVSKLVKEGAAVEAAKS